MNNNKEELDYTYTEDLEGVYNFYDKIVAATYSNISYLSKDNNIIIKDYKYNKEIPNVFLEVASYVAGIEDKLIYIKCNLFDYIRIKLKRKNKRIRRAASKMVANVDPYEVAYFEAQGFDTTMHIFEEIYWAYYAGKETNEA